MKRIILLLVICCLGIVARAQTRASNYTFGQSSGSYTALSGATGAITGAWTDAVATVNIGFTFNYMGMNFTKVVINANGYITFGNATVTAATSTGMTTLGTNDSGVVAASSCNLQASSGSDPISYLTSGSAGSRIFTVEYKNARFQGSAASETWSFQIKLYETSNIIQVVYGTNTTPTTSRTCQAGIRGMTVADFNNRTTTTSWTATTPTVVNSSTCTRSTTVQPASGLTFSWCPTAASPTVTASVSSCTNTYTATASGASTYTWLPATALSASTGSSVTATASNTVYTVTGVQSNGCGNTARVAANVFGALPTSAAASACVGNTIAMGAGLTSAIKYDVSSISYSLASMTSPTSYTLTSGTTDDGYCTVTLPFTFNYYGTSYSTIYLGTNGFVNFASAPATTNYGGFNLPSASGVTTCIDLFHRDLNLVGGTSANLTYSTEGTAPFRKFVIYYFNVSDYGGAGGNSGQIVLYESTNIIDVIITNTTSNTHSCAAIQNAGGTIGITAAGRGYLNGATYQISTPEAWRFTPATTSASTYAWSPASGMSSTTTNNPTLTVSSTTTYSVSITNGGCTYTGTKAITANALPSMSISPAAGCFGIPMTASGASTYSWSPSTSLSATTGATVTSSPTVAITYTITGTSALGCVNTTTKLVNLRPTIGVTPSTANFCTIPGTPVALTGSSSGGSTTYTWTPSTTLSASTGVTVNSTPTATTTTYTLTGTEASTGCSNTATSVITKLVSPGGIVPFVASDTVICLPGYALMTETGTGGTWSSSDPSVFTIDAGGGVFPVAAGTAKVYYTSPCGTDSLSIRVGGGGFSLTATPSSSTYCASGSPVSITVTSTDAGTDTWLWTDIGGGAPIGLSSTSTPTSNASPSVTAVYAIFGTNSTTGCHAVVTDTVINNTPAAITGTNTVCTGLTRTYVCATGGGTWSSSAPGNATVDPSTGVITGVVAGTATITYTVTATGCYVTRGITVNASPTLSFTPSAAYACGGIGVAVTASGASTYTWSPATGLSATTGATVTANPGSTTTYTISGTSAAGCVGIGTKTVNFGATYMAGYFSAAADTVCPGGTDVLTGQPASSTTGYNASTITYSFVTQTSPTTYSLTSGTTDDGYATATIPFSFNYFGTNYTTVYMSTNGYISFSTPTTNYGGVTLPNATAPTNAIALFNRDLNVAGASPAGNITYSTEGTAPNRKFVIYYYNVCTYLATAGGWTGEIILYESSNMIDVLVTSTPSTSTSATIAAIQNAAGSIAAAGSGRNYNAAYTSLANEAYRFIPSFPSATYAWAGSTTSATTGTPVTATVSGTQTYTVTVTDPASGCNGSYSKTIYNYTNPTISIAPSTVCVGTPMTASGAVTYSWSPSTGLATTTGATVTPTSYTAITYTATGTDAHGCQGTATKAISFPTISVSPSSSIFCSAGSAVGLTASGTSVSYSWSPSAGLSAVTGASVNASPTVTTVYTVIGTDASGCAGPATSTVTYNASSTTITGAGGSSSICLPGTLALSTDGTGGAWSSSDTTIATVDGAGIVTGVSTGSVTITYNNTTCGYATYGIIILPGGFTVSLTPSSGTYCASGSALSITASGGTTYTWAPGTDLSATTGATVSASPSATRTYTVTGVTGGCSNTATITVTNNTPVAITGGTTSVCTGLTTTWTNATGGGTWSSSAPGVATVNPSTGVITGVTAGSATITYTVTATGCYVTRSITINPTPTMSFTPSAAYACGGIGVSVSASGASTYTWSPATGLSASTGATVTANPGSTTTYTITGTSAAGCIGTGTKTVNFGTTAMLAYAAAAPSSVCPGTTTTLTGAPASSSTYTVSSITPNLVSFTSSGSVAADDANSGAVTLPFTFNFYGVNYTQIGICTNGWASFTDFVSANLTNYAFPTASAPLTSISFLMHDLATAGFGSTGAGSCTYGTTGTAPYRKFVIYYNGIGNYSGGNTNTGQIILNESSNTIDIVLTAVSNGTTAYNSTVGIQNQSGSAATTASTYNGAVVTVSTPQAYRFTPSFPSATYAWVPTTGVTSTAAATTTATVSATTVYTVTVTDPASGCNASFSTTVNAFTPPTVTISPSIVCSGTPMTASGASTYTWGPATGLSSTAGATVTPTPSVVTTYTATGIDTNGCVATATKTITFPSISLTPTSALYCSSGSPVSITASGSGISYSWSPSAGLSASTGTSVSASPTVTTIYTVTATDASGCTNIARDTITYNVATSAISGPSSTLCLPGTMVLTETGTGGIWSSSDTTISVVNTSGIVTGVTAGGSTITYNNAACGGFATYSLTNVSGGFTISVTPSSGTYCSTGSALNATASGGTTYSWLPTAGLDVTTGTTVNASPTVTTVYTVTGTTSGCSNSATLTVTNNTPAPITGGVTTLCSAVTGAVSTTSTTWTCATGGGSWSSSAPTVASVNASTGVITGLSAGTATITYNISGCYVTRSITINASPAMSFTPAVAASCAGASVALTASGASTYSWTPATGLSSSVSATPTATPTITTVYTVTGTSAAGCISTTTKTVNVSGTAMLAYATSSPTQVCTGGVTTLSGAVASSATGYNVSSISYSLASFTSTGSVAGDDVNSGAVTLPFSFNFYGVNYSTIYVCTNGWASFTNTSSSLTNYAFPSTTAPTSCISLLMHDLATSGFGSTGAGSCTYGTTGTAPNRKFVIYYNGIGNYSGGNTNTGQIILNESSNTIDVMLTAFSNGTTAYNSTVGIQNQAGTIATTASTYNGTVVTVSTPEAYRFTPSFPSATYAWSPTTGVTSSAAATTTATVTATTTYTVTVTDPATGCYGTFTTTDTAVAQPTVTVTSTRSNFCSGGQDSLIAVPSGGIGPITSYSWSGPGISTTTGSFPGASFTPTTATTTSGSYTVSVAYAGTGCNNAVNTTSTVTLNSDPIVTVSPSATSLCVGGNLTLTESLTSGGSGTPTYSWSGPGISTTTGTSSTSPTFTPSVSTGAYSVAVTYSGVGCDVANANTGTVTVNPIAGIVLGANPSICQPTTGTVISFTSPTGSPTNYNLNWGATALSDGFSNVSGGTLSGSTISLPIPSTSISGVYTGTITVTNAGGCNSTGYSFTLTVYAYPTASIASVTPPCSGYATTVTFNGTTGASITYKVDAGSTLTAVLTGGSYGLSTGAITSAHTYHLLSAFNPVCSTTLNDSVVVTPTPQVWLGTTSTDWNTGSNWACGFVPASGDDISIPAGTPNAPAIAASSTGTARNITLASGATVTVGSGGSLNITGSSTLNGTVTGAGYATFNGSSAQSISGNFTVTNMKLNNTAGLTVNSASKVVVKGILGITAGTLNTGDSLTLYSDSLGTARVDSLPASGASISGQARVMVYVPGGRRVYRFWSHPFNSYIGLNQAINYIDITGAGGPSNGFTYSASASPSAFRYNPLVGNSSLASDPGWKAFTNTGTVADSNRLHQYQGIRMFFRGAKGEGLGYLPYVPSAVQVTQWGTLNQGTQTVTLSKGSSNPYQEYNMIGNPYASPVDIGTIIYNGLVSGNVVGPAYFVWNPNLGAAGQFQAQFITTTTAVPYYMQACNSFQVRAAYNGATLTFRENNKVPTPTTNLFKEAPQYVSLQVFDAKYHPYDMLFLSFNDQATDGDDHDLDAIKPFGGADLNFYSIASDNSKMVIDARPYDADKVIPLGIAATTQQDYIIKAASIAVPDGGQLYLHDKLLKQYVMLSQGTEYRFSVSDNAATQGDNRFEISMKPATMANTGLKVSIVPNPATDDVNISFVNGKAENVAVRILDMAGVSIYNKNLGLQNTGTVNVQLSNFASGIYMVELTSGSQKVVQRLVKE